MPRRKKGPAAQPVAAAYLAVLTEEGARFLLFIQTAASDFFSIRRPVEQLDA